MQAKSEKRREIAMKFECCCKTDSGLKAIIDDIHSEKCGTNFEVCARLWYSSEYFGKTIMVEYQVTTQECRELTENEDEPDWFTAYEVDDEEDDDCSDEIFTATTDNYADIRSLEEAMGDFAKEVFQRFYKER